MRASNKTEVRRSVRAAFPGQVRRAEESAALCQHVIHWRDYQLARVIGGYMPLAWEADITPLLMDVLASGRMLTLPRIESDGMMTFRRVCSMTELVPGALGILEPSAAAEKIPVSLIDLLLVPLEAIDSCGKRLGKGGGYYDRLLVGTPPVTLGMVLSWQWVEDVPCERWDKPLSAAADCHGIRLFNHEKRKDC